jgi:hypothetical protein
VQVLDLMDKAPCNPKGDTTMRFMIMVKSAEGAGPPPMALMAAIAKLGEEAMRAGAMVETGGLLPSAMGARVRLSAGKLTVTDGPFAESKELIGGYAVYDVKSKQEDRMDLPLHAAAHRPLARLGGRI